MSLSTSPTLSSSSLGSYDDLHSDSQFDSDDEIVYLSSLSSSTISGTTSPSAASDDFIVLSRPLSPSPSSGISTESSLSASVASLSIAADPSANATTPTVSSVRLPQPLKVEDYPTPTATPRPLNTVAIPPTPTVVAQPILPTKCLSPRLARAIQGAEEQRLVAQRAVDAAIPVFGQLQRAAALALENSKQSTNAELREGAKVLSEQAVKALKPLNDAKRKLKGVTNTLLSLAADARHQKKPKKAAKSAKVGEKLVGAAPQSKAAKKKAKKAAAKAAAANAVHVKPKSKGAKKRAKKAAAKAAAANTVPSSPKGPTVARSPVTESQYEEAAEFISSFLANPVAAQDKVCRLTLLQSFLVEFGVTASDLPTSLRAAKAAVKSTIFVNIKEYLAMRGQGREALQKLMLPSRAALARDIRKKKNPASLKTVKGQGLQALLIHCLVDMLSIVGTMVLH
ncbi:hypothetical protein HGRIS_013244 [Hohenbuehelia grisea]|uniref:Uncharacterized protein n=1 Tax=Hohenbuehelia grisea TaxID=104357 RepID=A0ABR3IUV8_9AGAR